MPENAFMEKGDEALRFVGKVKLWMDIGLATVLGLATLVSIVAILAYHADWKQGSFMVTKAECGAPERKTSCDDQGKCDAHMVTHCSALNVEGFDQTFTAEYREPSKPPTVHSKVKVFFDPKDKSKAFLAHDDFVDENKLWIILGLSLFLAAAVASAWFQYYVRRSHLAQRIMGGTAVFDLATGNGF